MARLYDAHIQMRMTKPEKELIRKAAKLKGLSMSEFIRGAALDEARWVIGHYAGTLPITVVQAAAHLEAAKEGTGI